MDSSMDDILRRMGWTTGMHVPIANDENKALQDKVERLMMQKARATEVYETEEARYSSIENHLKFVKQQNTENQNLITTYQQHLDSQEHKFLLTQAEKDSVQQGIRQMEKSMQDIESRITSKKGDLDKGLSKMEKMKSETSWDNEALKAWEESLKKRDEDNELLKKFSREDEKKAKDLETKRQNLEVETVARKQTLAKLIGDLTNSELVLERIEKVFKQLKQERKALIKQWQEAIKNLKQRDHAIKHTIKEIEMTQELVAEQKERLDEQNNFLINEINNNKEVEQQIEELNVHGSKMRRDLNDLIQYVLTLNSEASSLKRNLISTANFLEKERGKGRNLAKEMTAKENRIKQLEAELDNLKQKLADINNTSMSAADRARRLEQILEREQRQNRALTAEIEQMQGVLFRTQQNMWGLKDAAKLKEMGINGCETAINLLKKHVQEVNNNLQRQKEINYSLDYRINQMESRLDKLEGQYSDEDKEAREEKIVELDRALSEENEVKQMLLNQVNQIEDEMRRLSTAIQSDNTQMNVIKDKLQNEVLCFEGGMKQTVIAKQNSQQRQVDENMLRLRVNQLENIMKREDYSIYTLQKYRVELETAMRERQIEINTNKEILIAKRRNLDEEKSRLKRDINLRQIKIEQLQKRFTIAIMALGKDEDGQPLSVTHFKIKNAQEKYMLQQEGDELDAKVKRAEKEIVAMENTLRVVNTANFTYRQSLAAVEEYDEEADEMRILETEISNITATIRNRRKELANKKSQVKDLKQALTASDEERIEMMQALAAVEDEYADLQRYAIDQRVKLDRADRHLHTCMKNLDPRVCEKYHKNLVIRQLQDANKSGLQQLAEASTRYQEMTPHISRYTSEHELILPGPKLQYTPSSSSDSSRSSHYYASGPYVSSLLLTFDPVAPGGNKSAAIKHGKKTKKSKF